MLRHVHYTFYPDYAVNSFPVTLLLYNCPRLLSRSVMDVVVVPLGDDAISHTLKGEYVSIASAVPLLIDGKFFYLIRGEHSTDKCGMACGNEHYHIIRHSLRRQ